MTHVINKVFVCVLKREKKKILLTFVCVCKKLRVHLPNRDSTSIHQSYVYTNSTKYIIWNLCCVEVKEIKIKYQQQTNDYE